MRISLVPGVLGALLGSGLGATGLGGSAWHDPKTSPKLSIIKFFSGLAKRPAPKNE